MIFWNGMLRKLSLNLSDKILIGNVSTGLPAYMDVKDFPFLRKGVLVVASITGDSTLNATMTEGIYGLQIGATKAILTVFKTSTGGTVQKIDYSNEAPVYRTYTSSWGAWGAWFSGEGSGGSVTADGIDLVFTNGYTTSSINSSTVMVGLGKIKFTVATLTAYIVNSLGSVFSVSSHNHTLNGLSEKSYNSLTGKPTLDFFKSRAFSVQSIGDPYLLDSTNWYTPGNYLLTILDTWLGQTTVNLVVSIIGLGGDLGVIATNRITFANGAVWERLYLPAEAWTLKTPSIVVQYWNDAQPATPVPGDVWYLPTPMGLMYWDGLAWTETIMTKESVYVNVDATSALVNNIFRFGGDTVGLVRMGSAGTGNGDMLAADYVGALATGIVNKASKDASGNDIIATYATKDRLSFLIDTFSDIEDPEAISGMSWYAPTAKALKIMIDSVWEDVTMFKNVVYIVDDPASPHVNSIFRYNDVELVKLSTNKLLQTFTITATDGISDEDGNITGTSIFSIPVDLDISATVQVFDGSLLVTGAVLDSYNHTIDFVIPPLAENNVTIYYYTV